MLEGGGRERPGRRAGGGLSVQVGAAKVVTTDAAGRFTTEISGPGDYTAVVRAPRSWNGGRW